LSAAAQGQVVAGIFGQLSFKDSFEVLSMKPVPFI